MFGRSPQNLADNPSETALSKLTAQGLTPKWVAAVGANVSVRAAVAGGMAYFPDWAGNLWALDTATGKTVWRHTMQDYGLPAGTIGHTTPAVQGDSVYFGTLKGAYLVAVNKNTGALKWVSQMDTHPVAVMTSSPAILNGVIYDGVASLEENSAADPNYPCCSFRGSAIAVDAQTGKVMWKTYTVPAGYSGGGVWGSNVVVDAARQEVFLGTGDNYSVPATAAYSACIAAGQTAQACLSPDDHFDSLLVLDMNTGGVKWSRRLWSVDD